MKPSTQVPNDHSTFARIAFAIGFLILTLNSQPAFSGGKKSPKEKIHASVPVGQNGELGDVEVTLSSMPDVDGDSLPAEAARQLLEDIRREFPDEEIKEISFVEDPTNDSFTPEEMEAIANELGAMADVETSVGSMETDPKSKDINEARNLLGEMFAKDNLGWAGFRFVNAGASAGLAVVVKEGGNIISALPVAIVAGLLSASLQILNPLYMEWANGDIDKEALIAKHGNSWIKRIGIKAAALGNIDPLLEKYGTTPMRRLGIRAAAIWLKWGLVLEGIYLASIESTREISGLGANGFNFFNVGVGVTMTTAAQGMAEIVISTYRKSAREVYEANPTPENKLIFEKKSKMANAMVAGASFLAVLAAVSTLMDNHALSYVIYGSLGLISWTGAHFAFSQWTIDTVRFYRDRLQDGRIKDLFSNLLTWLEESKLKRDLAKENKIKSDLPYGLSKEDLESSNLSAEEIDMIEMMSVLDKHKVPSCAAALSKKKSRNKKSA
ncbi:MAG: hypothetical protein KDD25_04915 [Bdellovibrionales bacterium]|nr:hypothetical protein [Bdellovibrionales bacterium]